jgi:hypothetical protein
MAINKGIIANHARNPRSNLGKQSMSNRPDKMDRRIDFMCYKKTF